MIKKILLAVDGSTYSEKAGEYAIELAKALNAELTAINVVEISAAEIKTGGELFFSESPEYILDLDGMKKDSETLLSGFKEKAKIEEVEINTASKIGHVWNEIVEESEKGGYDLIVLGSKGLSGIKRMLIGSVAENVTRHSKYPVMIVK